jgi:hypothetical protein
MRDLKQLVFPMRSWNLLTLKALGKILEANERIYDKPGDIISRYGSNR